MVNIPGEFLDRLTYQWHAAAERYRQFSDTRENLLAKAEKEGPEAADTVTRVTKRRALVSPRDGLAQERIIGETDFLHANFLSRGLTCAKGVCRINILDSYGLPAGYGTGFMVSPDLMITNHHVLPTVAVARMSMAEFDFEYDDRFRLRPYQIFEFEPNRFFYAEEQLDFALVAVQATSLSAVPLSEYGFIRLIEESGKALVLEKVSLVQHPSGLQKQLSIRANAVEHAEVGAFLHYEADTLPGSSGAPVFNDDWQVVAVHHSSVPKRNSRGQILRKDGRIYQRGDHPGEIQWIANEGVRISAIFDHLKQRDDWEQDELRLLLGFANDPAGPAAQRFTALLAAQDAQRRVVITDEGAREVLAPAQRLSITEFHELLANPDITEEDIAPYFIEDVAASAGIDPVFRFNEQLVQVDYDDPTESALLLNSANAYCKFVRQRRYAKRIRQARPPGSPPPIRIVAEGDSWFQYPFLLRDIIDHLMAEDDLAVLCFSEAGDLLGNMIAKGEFYGPLERENASVFLISGGGNDLVAGQGLRRYLHPYSAQRDPQDYLKPEYALFLQNIAGSYATLFRRVLTQRQNVQLVCHAYSYAIPDPRRGKWLGKPMAELGINDIELQDQISRLVVDGLNRAVKACAEAAGDRVTFLDLRGAVPRDGWHDEFHPTSRWYGELARRFAGSIRHHVRL
ncbi:MAG: trypsin-like peptidase domain-containing protein [Gammaproteobacteria bacterium]